jgi:hypothetical protein
LTNTTKWLNFSSAVAPSASRRITAQISGVLSQVAYNLLYWQELP